MEVGAALGGVVGVVAAAAVAVPNANASTLRAAAAIGPSSGTDIAAR